MNLLLEALKEDNPDKFVQFVNTGEWLTTDQILSSSLEHSQAPGE